MPEKASERSSQSNPLGRSQPLAPALYQSSVYTIPDLDALDAILDDGAPGYMYARDAHPNARQLALKLAEMEHAAWAAICGSGMAATTAALLSFVQSGDRIVASNRLYGRTTQLLGQEFTRFRLTTSFVDCGDLQEVRKALQQRARLLLVETLSNPLLRLVDVEALADIAHEHQALLIVDNTFLTPALTKPLELGADIVIESLTKMIGGHSDVTLGLVCGQGEVLPQVSQVISIWGLASNPFDCWLAERGLATLDLRMRTASANAAGLADWLPQQRGIDAVIYPGRTDHPDHQLAARVLHRGMGNMLCFDLQGGRDAVNRFLRRVPGIPFSPSLGHTTSTCSHPATTSHRYLSPAEKRRQSIGDGLVRLSVGVEDLDLIKQEIAAALS